MHKIDNLERNRSSIKGIKYITWYNTKETMGYFIAAKRNILSLSKCGIPITWYPMSVPNQTIDLAGKEEPDLARYYNLDIDYDYVIVHATPEVYPSWREQEANKVVIGYMVCDTDKLPPIWSDNLWPMDGLLVPASWSVENLRRGGYAKPIHVIPHIIDPVLSHNNSQSNSQSSALLTDINPTDYLFYTIGKWEERKVIWKTLEAYWKAFSRDDPVVFVIKTSKHDLTRIRFGRLQGRITRWWYTTERVVNQLQRKYRDRGRVKLISSEISEADISALHQRGNCYVSLTRAEGWGLGAFDAATVGNPVIMTGYGGQRDYLPKEYAFLVDYDVVPAHSTDVFAHLYVGGQHWAEPDVNHGAQLMRQVFNNQHEAQQKGERLKKYIHDNFNEIRIAEKIIAALHSYQVDKST